MNFFYDKVKKNHGSSQSALETDEEKSSSLASGKVSSHTSTINLPLAHYINNKNNPSQNFKDLDIIIAKAMSIPGSDASYQLKKKHSKVTELFEKTIGRAAQMIEVTGKALTTNLVITYYRLDTSNVEGVNQLKAHMENIFVAFNPTLSDILLAQLRKWLSSSYFNDYLKYYRDFRTDISKIWCKIFSEKPFAWIRNSLDNIICDGEELGIIYPCSISAYSASFNGSTSRLSNEESQSKPAIFGITGL
jgi:hypothetical protein